MFDRKVVLVHRGSRKMYPLEGAGKGGGRQAKKVLETMRTGKEGRKTDHDRRKETIIFQHLNINIQS